MHFWEVFWCTREIFLVRNKFLAVFFPRFWSPKTDILMGRKLCQFFGGSKPLNSTSFLKQFLEGVWIFGERKLTFRFLKWRAAKIVFSRSPALRGKNIYCAYIWNLSVGVKSVTRRQKTFGAKIYIGEGNVGKNIACAYIENLSICVKSVNRRQNTFEATIYL